MRTLKEIAPGIQADWLAINNAGAKEALECMKKWGSLLNHSEQTQMAILLLAPFLPTRLVGMGCLPHASRKSLNKCVTTRGHSMPPLFRLIVRSRWTRRLRRVHEPEHWAS